MDALAAELGAHRGAALADEGAVPPVVFGCASTSERGGARVSATEGLTWRPH